MSGNANNGSGGAAGIVALDGLMVQDSQVMGNLAPAANGCLIARVAS